MKFPLPQVIGGILLVAGTTIGAGMLALPITTGTSGFYWAVVLLTAAFLYMLTSLFMLLEANLYSKGANANIITMAKQHLGLPGKISAWSSFLLLLYAVSAAYMTAGGTIFANFAHQFDAYHFTPQNCAVLFAGVFGFIVYFGVNWTDRLNRVLMAGLIISYFATVYLVVPKVTVHHLTSGNPKYLWAAAPVAILAFTSHIILPSLRSYYQDHIPTLKKVLFFGSLMPLVFYLLWDYLLIGVLPAEAPYNLQSIATSSHPLYTLNQALEHIHLGRVATFNRFFSFFALATSFIGVLLSLIDFLADGLHIEKTPVGRLKLVSMSLLPPLLFALFMPSGFVRALKYAGVFVAILYGILPACMVWRARYQAQAPAPAFKLPGGKPALIIMGGLAVGIICLQLAASRHLLPTL